MYLRNQSPFLQVFGLPAPEGGEVVSPRVLETRLALSLANHADDAETATESVVLDGESTFVDVTFRYGLAERWEVGLDLPYVAHRAGQLDNIIEGWHDVFGLTNDNRNGPSNHLNVSYRRDGLTQVDLRDGGGGIGDVRVTGAYGLFSAPGGARTLALRSVVKLPTGDANRLRGSGATDLAVSLEGTDRTSLASYSIEMFGQAGLLRLGDGDLLPDQQQRFVPFTSLGLLWHWREAVDMRIQLAMQGEYFDSGVEGLGGTTTTVAVGGTVRLRGLGVDLDIALIEDLVSDATPDFGLHFTVRPTHRPP